MKKKVLALLLSACMVISMAGCSSGGKETAAGNTGGGGGEGSNAASAEAGDTSLPEGFNATGMPIMNEKITLKVWIEGGADIDWEQNQIVKEIEEKSNIKLQIISTPLSDALQKRNLMLASGDYPDLILTDWPTVFTKSDIMQYGVKEGVLLPITDYIDKYGNNMKRIFEYNPSYRDKCVAPDGEIYGFARFSECYHCSAYPKIYLRQDWMDKLGLKMPETT